MAAAASRHLVGTAAGILLVPIIAHALGADCLGAWAVLGTATFAIGVADLGLTTSVYRAMATGDAAIVRSSVGLAVAVIAGVSPLLAALSYAVVAALLPSDATTRLAIGVALAGGVVGAFTFPFRAFLLMRGGMRGLALARGFGSVVQIAVTVGSLSLSRSLLAVAVGSLAGTLVEAAFTLRGARGLDRALPVAPVWPGDRSFVRGAFRDGAATLTVNVAALAAMRIDVLIVAEIAPLALVAAYGIGARAVDQAYTLAKQIGAGLLPRLADARDRDAAVRVGTTCMGVLVASGMPALVLDGRPILVAWAGDVAATPTTRVVAGWLAAAAIIAACQELAASALTVGARTAWPSALALVAGTAVNLALSLVGAHHVGVWAVAAATLAGNVVTAVLVWRSATRLLGWGVERVVTVLAPVAAAGAGSTLTAHLLASTAISALSSLGCCAAAASIGVVLGGTTGLVAARGSARQTVEAA